MTESTTPVDQDTLVDYLKRVTSELRRTRHRLRSLEQDQHQPIAVIGLACRFAGDVETPEDLWRLLLDERDAIVPLPSDRGWDTGQSGDLHGGFLRDTTAFDAGFFDISPEEAEAMDPQHRLLLEICWEALERAGIVPASLEGSRTGVYVGVTFTDYLRLLGAHPPAVQGHTIIGNRTCMAAGRIAYTLGLRGPAIGVDTACSSSLVAIHLASRALRGGECSLALAGGVTIMATSEGATELSLVGALASDGRCKAFSAHGDGFGIGEGAGALLLERLVDAQRLGHPVLAVIRGSAVNQDGASNGLAAPNGQAQRQVIDQALADAGLRSDQIDAVEAHGTGTALGDPIELEALREVYGRRRPTDHPLWIGSVKSNIGHTVAAAGVAGVAKMILAMRHGTLPRTLHADEPTPHLDWSDSGLRLLSESKPWPSGTRRAGISSFGMSGTNAHLVLEQAPEPAPTDSSPTAPMPGDSVPWVISGRDAGALRVQARQLITLAQTAEPLDLWHAGAALATRRQVFEHRGVVVGADRAELLAGLSALARGDTTAHARGGRAGQGRLAFLFSGQGSQRAGTARELYHRFPAFTQAWDTVSGELGKWLDPPLDVVAFAQPGTPEAGLLDQTSYAQCALFALQTGLFELMRAFGVVPDLLAGHSVGELAVAHAAGVLDLTDACALVAARSRLMRTLPTGGTMIAIEADAADTADSLAGFEDTVAIAAINGPSSTVIAGADPMVAQIAARWRERGRRTTPLRVSSAFHSPWIDAILPELRAVADPLTYRSPHISVVSTVTGRLADVQTLSSPEYWVHQVRDTVLFSAAVSSLYEAGARTFIELGPDRLLAALVGDCLPAAADPVAVAGTLRPGRPEHRTLFEALAEIHVHGSPVDWDQVFAGQDKRWIDLPTYPFQRRRHHPAVPDIPTVPDRPAEPPAVPLRERLAGQTRVQQLRILRTMVRDLVASMLGQDTLAIAENGGTFLEMGYDSLSAAELTSRLSDATGLRLPAKLPFDHPTADDLSGYLHARLEEPGPGVNRQDGSNGLSALFQAASQDGRTDAAINLLITAGRARPAATGHADLDTNPIRLTAGHRPPLLICFTSLTVLSGPLEYARLGRALRDHHEVTVLPAPGFRTGELLPADLDPLIEALATTATACAAGGPFVLLGHSSGGWTAHDVAARLHQVGTPAAGLILLDTYPPAVTVTPELLLPIVDAMFAQDGAIETIDDTRLTAMGAYLGLFSDWSPDPLPTPTLVVRAQDPLAPGAPGMPRWSSAHTDVQVPGDHFSMLAEDAPATARAIHDWLQREVQPVRTPS